MVHLLLRRKKMRVKPFDVDVEWVSKTRNHNMATFWSADSDQERMDMLRMAKGGGSITSGYAKVLKKWERTGRLQVHCDTHIVPDGQCTYNLTRESWTKLNICSPTSSADPPLSSNIKIDHIFYATSSPPDLTQIPFLKTMLTEHPIEILAGLPVLTDDLAWSSAIPLFFTGGIVGLRLGPGAANLAGARLGAERVAWAVEEVLANSTATRSRESYNSGDAAGRWQLQNEDAEMIDGNSMTSLRAVQGINFRYCPYGMIDKVVYLSFLGVST